MGASARTRWKLARLWAGFVFAWLFVTWGLVFTLVSVGPCGGDGGEPSARLGSPRNVYCRHVDNYWNWGEPGNLAVVPFLIPLFVPILIGVIGVWRRAPRLLAGAAVALASFSIAYLGVPLALDG